jgi:hypothetical protein
VGSVAIISVRALQAVQVAGFAAMIGWIGIRTAGHVLHAVRSESSAEVRPLQTFQPTRWRSWRELPVDFEHVFNPRVELRDISFRRYARFKISRLGVSSTPRVLFGSDGWLFYNHDGEGYPYYTPGDPRLTARLGEWTRALPEWRAWLADRDIRLLIVIAPNKQSVYPENLPPIERKQTGPTPTDRLLADLRAADPALNVVDLRNPLRAARSGGPMYFKTDTHWLPAGARAGYEETARALGVTPLPPSRFRGGPGPTHAGDLTRLLGWWPHPPEPFDHLEVVDPAAREVPLADAGDDTAKLDYLDARALESPLAGGTRLVAFHDSFGDGLYVNLLAEHFARTVAIPSSHMDPAVIERERPAVVVLEIVERMFQGIGARRPTDPPRRSIVR